MSQPRRHADGQGVGQPLPRRRGVAGGFQGGTAVIMGNVRTLLDGAREACKTEVKSDKNGGTIEASAKRGQGIAGRLSPSASRGVVGG